MKRLLTLLFVSVMVIISCAKDDDKEEESPDTTIAAFTVYPVVGTFTTVFCFDASGSIDDETPLAELEVRWDWEDDGTYDTDWSTVKTPTHQYSIQGGYTIRLQVRDEVDMTDDEIHSVTVHSDGDPVPMTLIPSGNFMMGNTEGDVNEQPVHPVTLTHDFYLGTSEVTNEEYRGAVQWAYDQDLVTVDNSAVKAHGLELLDLNAIDCRIAFSGGVFVLEPIRGGHYSDQSSACHPVKEVSWYGAACYCDWLSLMKSVEVFYSGNWNQSVEHNPYTSGAYRLPTEAEWEYAAQYNDNRVYPWGEETENCDYANYGYCVGLTAPVGSCPSGNSSLGLQDMAGNLYEWVGDWYGGYQSNPQSDPFGIPGQYRRVLRGGNWEGQGSFLRCAARYGRPPIYTEGRVGFRICRTVNP